MAPQLPTLFWLGSAGLFGLVVGSFLNVCVYRLPRECMSLVHPRSRCPSCRNPIAAYDNIPVVSWLLLGGRCRHCRHPISARYPLVEVLTGALFAWAAWAQISRPELWAGTDERIALFSVHAWLLASLVAATFIDFDYKIIPDEITLAGAALAPFASLAFPFLHGWDLPDAIDHPRLAALLSCGIGMAMGGGTVWVFGVLGTLIFRKEAMGLGDVKLMAMIGGFLGWQAVILVFLFACVLGSICGIAIFLRTRSRYVAFGPYLAMGAIVMIFYNQPILDFIRHRWLPQ